MMHDFNTRRLWCFTIGGICLVAVTFAYISYRSSRDAWRLGEQSVSSEARLAEASLAREIELYNLSLQGVVDGVSDQRVMALPAALRSGVLFDRSATAKGLGFIIVLDPKGNIILDSKSDVPRRANLANREFFRVHTQEFGDNGLYVSTPFRAALDADRWTIALSRRITAPDGSFRGVVSGFIKLDYLNNALQNAAVDSGDIVTVTRLDGKLIGRSVFDEPLLQLNWTSGEVLARIKRSNDGCFVEASLHDGQQRLYAYRRIAGTPLVITVGVLTSQIRGPWLARTLVSSVLIAALGLAVLILVARLCRELRRRAEAERTAETLARTDALTGVANRRSFDEVLDQRAASGGKGGYISIIMIDVDWFKTYNDACGHLEGDHVLRLIAETIGAAVGSEDIVARYGGEEFAVILNHPGFDDARGVAQKIVGNVRATQIPHPASALKFITVSCGVATMPCGDPDSATWLVSKADAKLYAAKNAGRNRCEALAPLLVA